MATKKGTTVQSKLKAKKPASKASKAKKRPKLPRKPSKPVVGHPSPGKGHSKKQPPPSKGKSRKGKAAKKAKPLQTEPEQPRFDPTEIEWQLPVKENTNDGISLWTVWYSKDKSHRIVRSDSILGDDTRFAAGRYKDGGVKAPLIGNYYPTLHAALRAAEHDHCLAHGLSGVTSNIDKICQEAELENLASVEPTSKPVRVSKVKKEVVSSTPDLDKPKNKKQRRLEKRLAQQPATPAEQSEPKNTRPPASKLSSTSKPKDTYGCREGTLGYKANRYLEQQKKPVSMEQIREAISAETTVYSHMNSMIKNGHAEMVFRGKIRLYRLKKQTETKTTEEE